ncbi:MAG: hypothetical protein AAGF57_06525 [Pseudomonadota bacterium]
MNVTGLGSSGIKRETVSCVLILLVLSIAPSTAFSQMNTITWNNDCGQSSVTCNDTKHLPPFTQANIYFKCNNEAPASSVNCSLKEGNKPNVYCGDLKPPISSQSTVFSCTCTNNTPADPLVYFDITCPGWNKEKHER